MGALRFINAAGDVDSRRHRPRRTHRCAVACGRLSSALAGKEVEAGGAELLWRRRRRLLR